MVSLDLQTNPNPQLEVPGPTGSASYSDIRLHLVPHCFSVHQLLSLCPLSAPQRVFAVALLCLEHYAARHYLPTFCSWFRFGFKQYLPWEAFLAIPYKVSSTLLTLSHTTWFHFFSCCIYHSMPLGLTVCILSFLTRMPVPWKGPWPCSISFLISCVTSTFKKCSVKSIIISFSYIFKTCSVGGGACEEMDLFLSKCPRIIWWQEPDRPDVIRQGIFQLLWDQWCVIPPCLSQYFKTCVTQLFKPLHHLHQFFLLTHITCDPPNSSEF